jgi:transcriptional regulator with XRE-family HTH domain
MSTFGNRFKELRFEKRLTQQELADDFNKKYHYTFGKPAISQYENDKRTPELDALLKFADYFGVSVDYLLGRNDVKYTAVNNSDEQQDKDKFEVAMKSVMSFLMDEEIPEEDKEALFRDISELFWQAKGMSKSSGNNINK